MRKKPGRRLSHELLLVIVWFNLMLSTDGVKNTSVLMKITEINALWTFSNLSKGFKDSEKMCHAYLSDVKK